MEKDNEKETIKEWHSPKLRKLSAEMTNAKDSYDKENGSYSQNIKKEPESGKQNKKEWHSSKLRKLSAEMTKVKDSYAKEGAG